ncbi:hypothetical protein NDU88_005901 [Pleurodeles waltl]|uniref:Uncharacterized protein n=1 Tax=Pleurodeles waltl TaxID=8319 RepID=A0AAV7MXM5_PLEWA|nr:hypothetical protein NDU88_005901 [Pleurodeles waltl]
METKGGVTRSRDSKDFFEEKQLVTLRPNTRWRAIAEHANLLRLMPRTVVHWESLPADNCFLGIILRVGNSGILPHEYSDFPPMSQNLLSVLMPQWFVNQWSWCG